MRSKAIALLGVLLLAAACGGETGGQPPTVQPAPTTAGDSGPGPATEAPGGSQDAELPFESGDGYFEVDGRRLEAAWVVSCLVDENLYGEPAHPRDLDVRAFAVDGSTYFSVSVTVDDVESGAPGSEGYQALTVSPFLSWPGDSAPDQFDGSVTSGPDGSWYLSGDIVPQLVVQSGGQAGLTGEPAGDAEVSVDATRIGGALTLSQTWPEGESGTVRATWDFSVPAERFDCDEL